MTPPRPFIFLHLPKTGGVTLREIVERQYQGCRIYNFTGAPDVRRGFTMQSPRDRASFDLLTGHLRFGLHLYLDRPATYMTMLRNPLERVVSHYYYCRRTTDHYLYRVIHDQRLSLHDYVEQCATYEIDNDQVRWLTPLEHLEVPKHGVTRPMLEEAKHNLRTHFPVVGVTERFDESLVLMRRVFGWSDIGYERKNVGPERPRLADLSQETIAVIRDLNRFDLELHDFACALLDERIGRAGTGFAAEVREFQAGQACAMAPAGR